MGKKTGAVSSFANALDIYIKDIRGAIKPFLGITLALVVIYYLDFLNGIFTGMSGFTAGMLLIFSVVLLVLKTIINYLGSVSLYSMYPDIYENIIKNKGKIKLKFTELKKTFVIMVVFAVLNIPALIAVFVPLSLALGNLAAEILIYGNVGQMLEIIGMLAVPSVLLGIGAAAVYMFLLSLFSLFVSYEYFIGKQSIICSFKKSIILVKNNLVSSVGMLVLVTVIEWVSSAVIFLPALCCFIFPLGAAAGGLVVLPVTTLSKMGLWHAFREKPPKSL